MLHIVRLSGNGPLATVDLHTGFLYVNGRQWDALLPATRRFVELHELAHYRTQNTDELLADRLAFADFLNEGYHPPQALAALQTVLATVQATPATAERLGIMRRRVARFFNS